MQERSRVELPKQVIRALGGRKATALWATTILVVVLIVGGENLVDPSLQIEGGLFEQLISLYKTVVLGYLGADTGVHLIQRLLGGKPAAEPEAQPTEGAEA